MYPRGARPNRWQSLHMVCKYRDHHKPVYPLRRLATAIERGYRAKMHFTESFGSYAGYAAFVRGCTVAVRTWNHRQRDGMLPCTTD